MKRPTNPTLTEQSLFNGQETIPVTIEIPKELYEKVSKAHLQTINEGKSSLTIEQYTGSILQIGFNWVLYNELKKFFEKP